MPSQPSFSILLRVFLYTVGSIFAGLILAYLISITRHYIGLPQGDDIFLMAFPLMSLGSGIAFIMYAKKKHGNWWEIEVSGILGFFAALILLFFLLGPRL